MKIVFFGTPKIAVPTLKILNEIRSIEIETVITQPDKPVGRKQTLTPPPVKKAASKMNLKILQPKSKHEIYEALKNLEVDFFIVFAYGMILDAKTIKIPRYGSINIHTSLLPKCRGASPIQEALINGDKETGISIIKMDEKMDNGPLYIIKKIKIEQKDNLNTLTVKLATISAQILPLILEDIMKGSLNPIPQNKKNASYCKKINKKDGDINWNQSAEEINNLIRAYTPWPSVYTQIKGKKIKITDAEVENKTANKTPGTFFIENKILKIATKKGNLLPKKVQIEGKKETDVKNFLNGYKSLIG